MLSSPASSMMSSSSPNEFEVIPDLALKNENVELILGMPVNQLIQGLQNASAVIKEVELIYSKDDPFDANEPILINLKNDGIKLIVDPLTQLLKKIEVYDFRRIILKYGSSIFSSPNDEADIDRIEKCFGASKPGVFDPESKLCIKEWRGLSFRFNVKDPATVKKPQDKGIDAIMFSQSSLSKMIVWRQTNHKEPQVPDNVHCGNPFPQKITEIIEDGRIAGLRFEFVAEENISSNSRKSTRLDKSVRFGETEEGVLAALGAPSRIYYKCGDKMLIQRGPRGLFDGSPQTDLFFNYFTLGTDILIDHVTRRVIKFILHTNVPGHFDFGIYSRVEFDLEIPGTGCHITTKSKQTEFRSIFAIADDESPTDAPSSSNQGPTTGIIEPVVVKKSTTNGGASPFGHTLCYGRDQVIVEVMDHNDRIATVILYSGDTDDSYSATTTTSDDDDDDEDDGGNLMPEDSGPSRSRGNDADDVTAGMSE